MRVPWVQAGHKLWRVGCLMMLQHLLSTVLYFDGSSESARLPELYGVN